MKKYNYITSACFILLGIYVFIEASGYKQKGIGQQNPALWPEVIAAIMIICSIGLIIESVLKKEDKKTEKAAALAEGLDETEEMIREKLEEVSSGDLFAELSGGEEEEINWTTPGMKRVYAGMAMVVGFLVIMNIFGMVIALLCLIPGIMYLMNCKNKLAYILLPVGTVAFVYVFFAKVMTITLPRGMLF